MVVASNALCNSCCSFVGGICLHRSSWQWHWYSRDHASGLFIEPSLRSVRQPVSRGRRGAGRGSGGRQGQRGQAGAGGRQGMLPGAGEASQGQAEAGRGRHGHRLCTGVRGAAPALRLPQQRGAWCPSPNSTGAGHGRVITCVPELTDPDCTWAGISDSHADAGCVGGETPSSSDATAGAALVGGAVSVAA